MSPPTLLGIRHHGPGSARSVLAALDELRPTVVAVELPADTQALLGWIAHADLVPPVAILGHVVGEPSRAAFLPFAEFSPEWQAIRWAAHHRARVVAIDLPLSMMLAPDGDPDHDQLDVTDGVPLDPLGELAAAAGEPDVERWWDDVVEHRGGGLSAFGAVAEAMTAVRAGRVGSTFEARREAHMRRQLRALDAGAGTTGGRSGEIVGDNQGETVAVVCGAWHVPALTQPWPNAAADQALLRGLKKVKVGVSWVPWSHRRLAAASGYGAGVASPGWYAHLFAHPGDEGRTRWFVEAARLLRRRGMLASPDHLIAASRAAVSLAALRGRPAAGLAEVLDAADTVMAGSSGLALIVDQLVVGETIGAVPDDAPQVPLAADVNATMRRLRLKPATSQVLEVDLRTPSGRGRSVFLHRLAILGIQWGTLTDGRGSSGTFRETWNLRWQPEFAVHTVEAAAYGTTVAAAAGAALTEAVAAATTPADLIVALERALLAELVDVVEPCVRRLADAAASDPDVTQVIDALGPLSRTLRYGDVRGTHVEALETAFDGLVVRVLAGVVVACRGLNDEVAAAMVERLSVVQGALALCQHPARHGVWPDVLHTLAGADEIHGLIAGRATRLLHDEGAWPHEQVRAALSRSLSVGTPPKRGADFVEGFLAGSGTVLIHDRALLDLVDEWLSGLTADAFVTTVALLRRTFGGFAPAERRRLGQLLATGAVTTLALDGELDPDRLAAALATVRVIHGGHPLPPQVPGEPDELR